MPANFVAPHRAPVEWVERWFLAFAVAAGGLIFWMLGRGCVMQP